MSMLINEAIEVLKEVLANFEANQYDEQRDAVIMAISALEKQVGKKPTYRKVVYKHHEWVRDENGEIDNFAFESDYHNGPRCKRCGKAFCEHCCSREEYNEEINGGPCDCSYYECPACGEKVYSRQKVCDCGQKILWE